MRVLQQKQHGAVERRHQQIFENRERFFLALIRGHLDRGQLVLGMNFEQFRQQQSR